MSRIAIVLDFETTGFEVDEGAEPIELAAIAVNLDSPDLTEVGRFPARLMKPKNIGGISMKALEVNKITLEELLVAEEPYKVFMEFAEWAKGFIPETDLSLPPYKRARPMIMAHNAKFDIMFLKWGFKNYVPGGMATYNEIFHYHTRDTFEIAAFWLLDVMKLNMSCSLENLAKYFEIPHDAHTAMGDVIACLEVYKQLLKASQITITDSRDYRLLVNEEHVK